MNDNCGYLEGYFTNDTQMTNDYNKLENKPKINNVELVDNISLDTLGIQPKGDYALTSEVPKPYDDTEIKKDIKDLQDNKADSSDIPNVSSFITNTVSDLLYYYTKTQTYSKEEVNTLIGNLHSVSISLVDTLPTTGETNIIYLVPRTEPEEGNVKDEYIYVNNTYEKIGSTDIDLSDYVTTTMLEQKLALYTTELRSEIPTKTSQLYNDSSYVTETELNDIVGNVNTVLSTLTTVSEVG